MPAPIIPTLPDAPQRRDSPTDFAVKADAFVNALGNFGAKMNEFGAYMDALTAGQPTSTKLTNLAAGKVISETGTARTLALGDAEALILCTNASPITITVPDNSSVAFSIGDEIHLRQYDTGSVTVVADIGVDVYPPNGGTLVLAGVDATVTLKKITNNEWVMIGHTVAA